MRSLVLVLDERNGKLALVAILLGTVAQFVPWALNLMGITLDVTLGWIVMALSVALFIWAMILLWPLHRIGASLMITVVIVVSIVTIVKRILAPLRVTYQAFSIEGEYPAGTRIGGIVWNPKLTDLRVWVRNVGKEDLENLDIVIRPDTFVFRPSILTPVLGCELLDVSDIEIHDSVTDPKTGKRMSNGPPDIAATNSGYRLKCSKLPARFTLKIVFAAVTMNHRLESGELPYALFGPRPSPRSVAIDGSYKLESGTFSIDQTVVSVGRGN